MGEALEPVRNRVKIATKFGIRFDTESGKVPSPIVPDSRPEVIKKSVEGSLARLRTGSRTGGISDISVDRNTACG